jgi:hypothetical protein
VLALIRVHSSLDAIMLVPPNRRRSQGLRKADTLGGMALLLPALVFFVTAAQQPSTAPAQDRQPSATVHVVANVDPVLQADLRRLFEDLGVDKLLRTLVDQATDSMTTLLKSDARLTPEFIDEFVRRTKEGLLDGRVQDMTMQEYAKFFTHEELQQMIAYRESPVARKAAQLAPRMMTDISTQVEEIVQELGKQTALDIARQHPEYLKTSGSGADAGAVVMGILGAAPDMSSSPAILLRAQDYPLEAGTTWTYHLRKEVGPLARFAGEDARIAKNGAVETTLICHVAGTEQINGKTYTRVEALRAGKLANVDWYALTPSGLMHPKSVDYTSDSHSDFDPPEILLKPTTAPGESWTWQDRQGATSKKTASAPEQITVPAGSYRATPVHTQMSIPTKVAPMDVTITQWFAPGVGVVKQDSRLEINGHLLMHNTMTLEKFERAAPK